MIPNKGLALAFAALLLAGCGRAEAPGSPVGAERKEAGAGQKPEAAKAPAAPVPLPAPAAQAASAPDQALAAVLLEKETIAVAGQPACAMTVRFGDGEPQPVTWRGEACAQILVRLVSIEDLRKISQDSKLGEEARDDLARLPGRRALYVEGGHSSALYNVNVMDRVYQVPLAD
jgi:hypothetical protein